MADDQQHTTFQVGEDVGRRHGSGRHPLHDVLAERRPRPMTTSFEFTAPLWRWEGDAGWHFVTLPHDVADEIEERSAPTRRGFGSVRVEVTVGATTWATSLFPDTKVASYVLPFNRAVRDAEGLRVGDSVSVRLATILH